jgi:hypothetical protein
MVSKAVVGKGSSVVDGMGKRSGNNTVGEAMVRQRSSVVDGVSQGSGNNTVGKAMVSKAVVSQRSGVDGVGQGSDGGVAHRDGAVGSDGRLDLRQSLEVVGLSHRGVGGAESLVLDEAPLLSVGGGDGLVGGLATDSVVGNAVVGQTVTHQDLGGSRGSSEDRSKANKRLQQQR